MFWISSGVGYMNQIADPKIYQVTATPLTTNALILLRSFALCYYSDKIIKPLKVPICSLSCILCLSTYFSKENKKIKKLNEWIPSAFTALFLAYGTYAAYHRKKEAITTLGFFTGTLLGKFLHLKYPNRPNWVQDRIPLILLSINFLPWDTSLLPTFKITNYVTKTFSN